ncbi:MAG: hypothetical protein HOO06_13325 [Bdellovibrionaceae bacterium]|nr:hypothetical protein [Pseudobdellovibrionaceae bacterium]
MNTKLTTVRIYKELIILFILSLVFSLFQNCGQMRTPQASGNLAALSFKHYVLTDDQGCILCHDQDRPSKDHADGENNCKTCHITSTWEDTKLGTSHNPTPNSCNNCHGSGQSFDQISEVSPTHIETSGLDCISCHQSSIQNEFQDWKNSLYPHTTTNPATCNSCHDSGMRFDHVSDESKHEKIDNSGQDCISCHTNTVTVSIYTTWSGALFNHETANVQSCNSCHADGADYDLFPEKHSGVGSADCVSCHGATLTNLPMPKFTSWLGWDFKHDLAGVQNCESCHGNTMKYDKISNLTPTHIETSGFDCVACHQASSQGSFQDWNNSVYPHALTQPEACNSCHNSTMRFDQITNEPKHNNIDNDGKDCIECHLETVTVSNYTSWSGAIFDHATANVESCNSCHSNGADYDLFPVGHSVVGTADCVSCHGATQTDTSTQAAYTGWLGWRFSHPDADVQSCNSCHESNKKYGQKISNYTDHMSLGTSDCLDCHRASQTNDPQDAYTGWKGGKFDHQAAGLTSCNGCHSDGAKNDFYPANHSNIGSADCIDCHSATQTNNPQPAYTSWLGWSYNHTLANAQTCNSCHNTTKKYDKISSANPAHIGTSGLDCVACHQSTTQNGFSSWENSIYPHSIIEPATCNNCHNATMRFDHISNEPKHKNIDNSGQDCVVCHSNTVNVSNYSTWSGGQFNHQSANVESCNSCHATGADQNSFPLTHSVVGTADCIACHMATQTNTPEQAYTSWTGWSFSHSAANVQTCNSCHNSNKKYGQEIMNTPSHLTVGNSDCVDCHMASLVSQSNPTVPAYSNWYDGVFDHNTAKLNSCNSCHANNMSHDNFPSTHLPVGTADCINCHKVSSTTFVAWSWEQTSDDLYDHVRANATNCNSCHNIGNQYDSKLVAFKIIKSHTTVTTAQCTTCHLASTTNTPNPMYTSWAGAEKVPENMSLQAVTYGTNKYSVTMPGQFNNPHPDTTNTSCASCHANEDYSVKARDYAHTGNESCVLCHLKGSNNISTGRLTQKEPGDNKHEDSDGINWYSGSGNNLTPEDCTFCHRDNRNNFNSWKEP